VLTSFAVNILLPAKPHGVSTADIDIEQSNTADLVVVSVDEPYIMDKNTVRTTSTVDEKFYTDREVYSVDQIDRMLLILDIDGNLR
jgi:hypothetical protein